METIFYTTTGEIFARIINDRIMEENKKNVFVYIQGVKDRGDEVINRLKGLGAINPMKYTGDACAIYFIDCNGEIDCIDDDDNEGFWVKQYYTEVFLPEQPKPKHEFKPKDWVLVRDYDDAKWELNIFGRYDEEEQLPYRCVIGFYKYCIPYEGNESLLGTTDKPKR